MKRLCSLCIFTLVTASLLAGCLPEEPYEACRFKADQKTDCDSSSGDETKNNCVVKDHPQCTAGICISFRNSSPFCTEECVTDADCPDDGVCESFAISCTDPANPDTCQHYCVKGSLVE